MIVPFAQGGHMESWCVRTRSTVARHGQGLSDADQVDCIRTKLPITMSKLLETNTAYTLAETVQELTDALMDVFPANETAKAQQLADISQEPAESCEKFC